MIKLNRKTSVIIHKRLLAVDVAVVSAVQPADIKIKHDIAFGGAGAKIIFILQSLIPLRKVLRYDLNFP